MNIYITKDNEEFLKGLPTEQSMSGIINTLLNDYRSGKGADLFPQHSVKVGDIKTSIPDEKFVPRPPDPETGYPCCLNKSPCKHWQWDSNLAVWVNNLTGKTRETL